MAVHITEYQRADIHIKIYFQQMACHSKATVTRDAVSELYELKSIATNCPV